MNTTLDDGGPVASIMTLGDKGEVVPVGGLSIRDWLAGMAITCTESRLGTFDADEIASRCYQLADAMLAARKEKP